MPHSFSVHVRCLTGLPSFGTPKFNYLSWSLFKTYTIPTDEFVNVSDTADQDSSPTHPIEKERNIKRTKKIDSQAVNRKERAAAYEIPFHLGWKRILVFRENGSRSIVYSDPAGKMFGCRVALAQNCMISCIEYNNNFFFLSWRGLMIACSFLQCLKEENYPREILVLLGNSWDTTNLLKARWASVLKVCVYCFMNYLFSFQ